MFDNHFFGKTFNINTYKVGRIEETCDHPYSDPYPITFRIQTISGESGILTSSNEQINESFCIYNFDKIHEINIGDIFLFKSNGTIQRIYDIKSQNNALFFTNQCNSFCLMCSQPPSRYDDKEEMININSQLVSLLPKSIEFLGITGGEPTLYGDEFFVFLHFIQQELPNTTIQILTNGRYFNNSLKVEQISLLNLNNIVFCIPLYSDNYLIHDYIVQSSNAFDETLNGLYNLGKISARIEIRFVLSNINYPRILNYSIFIQKNLPFIEHLAFMGLEHTGFAIKNYSILHLDNLSDFSLLSSSVHLLTAVGFNISVYNIPLCLLPEDLWPYSRKSISEWKREYSNECTSCSVLDECGGFFSFNKNNVISKIKSISKD